MCPPKKKERAFSEAIKAGREAVRARPGNPPDPAGEVHESLKLRALGKWRFILIRGIIGWGIPMFLWTALSTVRQEVGTAVALRQPVLQRLFGSWVAALVMSTFIGVIVRVP